MVHFLNNKNWLFNQKIRFVFDNLESLVIYIVYKYGLWKQRYYGGIFFIDITHDRVYYFVLYRVIKSNKTHAFEDIFDI